MSLTAALFDVLLVLNGLWFTAAFHYFSFTPHTAAKLLVPPASRTSPLFLTLAASLRFLGAMNLSLALLALLPLVFQAEFAMPAQRVLFCVIFFVAHAGQFVCNVPVARKGRRHREALWPVLSGPMFFIFFVDGVLGLANLALAGMLLVRP